MRYLGVFLKAGTCLKFNFEQAKRKFYAAVNGIISKVGTGKPDIVLSLCNSFAVPCLLYGTEAMLLNKSERKTLDNSFRRLFAKLFKSFDNSVISYCQYYMNCLPMSETVILRATGFYRRLTEMSSATMLILGALDNKNKNSLHEYCGLTNNQLKNRLLMDFKLVNNIVAV